MSNFTYLTAAEDRVQSSAILASSSNGSFPASNMKYDKAVSLAQVWKSGAAVTDVTILFDLAASPNWNIVAMLNHNLSYSATVTLTAGTTNACLDFTQVMTWREFDMYYRHTATFTYRYFKLTISDGANSDGYISIGKVFCGPTVTLTSGFEIAPAFKYSPEQRVNVSDLRRMSVDRLTELVELSVKWIPFREVNRLELITFLRGLHGSAIPLFLILDTTVYEGYYMRQTSVPSDRRHFKPDVLPTSFIEESRGRKLI